MTLDDYLRGDSRRPKTREVDFADKIGCDQSTVNRIRNGQSPSPKLARVIVEETGGLVTLNDLFGIAA